MIDRPRTLREIAERAEDLSHFGREFADWLHTLRAGVSRPEAAAAIAEEPALLRERFAGGAVADAWLAAYAEYLAEKIDRPAPKWSDSSKRISPKPWFSTEHPDSRRRALRDSPPPFKNRNLFTEKVDLPLRLRAGRPRKSADEKRRANAERQRRFRARRAVELQLLREVAANE
jgi:hypothetical protein